MRGKALTYFNVIYLSFLGEIGKISPATQPVFQECKPALSLYKQGCQPQNYSAGLLALSSSYLLACHPLCCHFSNATEFFFLSALHFGRDCVRPSSTVRFCRSSKFSFQLGVIKMFRRQWLRLRSCWCCPKFDFVCVCVCVCVYGWLSSGKLCNRCIKFTVTLEPFCLCLCIQLVCAVSRQHYYMCMCFYWNSEYLDDCIVDSCYNKCIGCHTIENLFAIWPYLVGFATWQRLHKHFECSSGEKKLGGKTRYNMLWTTIHSYAANLGIFFIMRLMWRSYPLYFCFRFCSI